MCGLIGGAEFHDIEHGLAAIQHRGPDGVGVHHDGRWTLGHTRLAIVDVRAAADQPMSRGDVTLTFNGEVWNHATLRDPANTYTTTSDTESLAWHLATATDPGSALAAVEGMFAAVWLKAGTLHLARDRWGEIPLHIGYSDKGLMWCSEIAPLLAAGARPETVQWVPPAHYGVVQPDGTVKWSRYYSPPGTAVCDDDLNTAAARVQALLGSACTDRAMSDVPVACLISGGIDSGAVAFHLADSIPDLTLYTAVRDATSRDLKCARQVAERLNLQLVEVAVPAPTADDLAATVRAIEQPAKAQVEIAWACLHLAQRLQGDGIKVVLSGEGADELFASYGMAHHGIEAKGWWRYRHDAFLGQHRKNFARCNKVFMRHSVECRLPFLHTPLVDYALGLPRSSVEGFWDDDKPSLKRARVKLVLRKPYESLLPEEVVRRPKAAFQIEAGIDIDATQAVANPQRFYRSEFTKAFTGVTP